MSRKKSKRNVELDTPKEEVLIDPVGTSNLIGFFALLLTIDKRLHPEKYALPKKYND